MTGGNFILVISAEDAGLTKLGLVLLLAQLTIFTDYYSESKSLHSVLKSPFCKARMDLKGNATDLVA